MGISFRAEIKVDFLFKVCRLLRMDLSKETEIALSFVNKCYGDYENISYREVINDLADNFRLTKLEIKNILFLSNFKLSKEAEVEIEKWVNSDNAFIYENLQERI